MKMAIFFPDFRFGTRKVWGNFRHRKVDFRKLRNFAEIGCIFATYRKTKTAKKKDVFRELGFPILDDFSGNFPIYTDFTPILSCVPAAQSVFCEKHRKCTNFSGISEFGNRENFPGNFRAVFFSDGFPFFRISGISGNRTKFLRNLHSDTIKMAHNIAFLKTETSDFRGHSREVVPAKTLEMSRYASRETHRKPPRITRVHEAAQPVF
jgi:hypothetical protein